MAYSKEQWETAKGLFEIGYTPQQIADEVGFKSRDTVSKRATKEDWEKNKILQEKNDILALERENSTIQAKNSTMVEKISTLEDYQITILKDVVEEETRNKSLLFSTASLSLIRKNQMLTKNTKQVLTKEKIFEDGKVVLEKESIQDIELNASDIKILDDGIDKNAMTLEIAPRHAGSQITVNTQTNVNTNLEWELM